MDFSDRQQEPGKKFLGLGLVIVFHIVLVYALVNGLGTKLVEIIQKPLEAKLVEEIKPPPPPPDVPPPPPPKLLAPPPPFIPPPEVQVQPQVQPQNTIAAVSNVKPEPQVFAKTPAVPVEAPKAAAGPSTIAAVIDFNVAGCKPEYPRASLRNEETGTVLLSVLIGADGAVTEVKVDKSSGFRGLDNAVRLQLMSGACKNKPGTVDGKPQATWTKVQYVWRLD
ncbi:MULTISPECIES: energy transducer TonB [unclassified Undibacterium]|uniref:energy transducer TonB n=3 Tax=Undibacterium TaxID=401469 RepID=UPI002AC9DB3A|nr:MULTISPECIES: energy transducer TonB [unclassified Undibacterium]MEB0139397.1 energy transducer TonB [Undibacterium sp. CCC2.1]WPX44032.1 energy transducer TonB [Undibacterium sp. CCC3.4]